MTDESRSGPVHWPGVDPDDRPDRAAGRTVTRWTFVVETDDETIPDDDVALRAEHSEKTLLDLRAAVRAGVADRTLDCVVRNRINNDGKLARECPDMVGRKEHRCAGCRIRIAAGVDRRPDDDRDTEALTAYVADYIAIKEGHTMADPTLPLTARARYGPQTWSAAVKYVADGKHRR